MKMFWKRMRVAACLLVTCFLMAGPALAVDSLSVSPTIVIGQPSGVPTAAMICSNATTGYVPGTSTQFVSGKTVTAVFNISRLYNPILSSSGALVSTVVFGSNLTAAADSLNFSFKVGPTASGPWTSIYAMGNATATLTGTTPFVVSSANATSAWPPMPYAQVVVKAKKTFTGEVRVYTIWPYPRTTG